MMTLQELKDWLALHKGTARWREVAARADVDYGTVSRIARGHMTAPSMPLGERLTAAIRAVEADQQPA